MVHKLSVWNRQHGNLRMSRKKAALRRPRFNPQRDAILGVEWLEDRAMLSINPVLTVINDQFVNEGAPLSITNLGSFTDVVEGAGGATIGLNPLSFASLGSFDPLANVVIDTTALTISGGFTGTGTTVSADVGFGPFQIAVFAFSSFELDAGRTITATGSRPFALLSHSDLTVAGTIDVSANLVTSGPGGGRGGEFYVPQVNGVPAAGAPSTSRGTLGSGASGSGGGFGGAGGRGESSGGASGVGGQAYGDLSIAIQGGSGGSIGALSPNPDGGGGGGGIELGAVGTVTISSSGLVLAKGGDGGAGSFGTGGGGGAGGGILVHGTNVAQNGMLSAQGGDGGSPGVFFGGGGGGGRIMLVHSPTGIFTHSGTENVAGGLEFGVNSEPGGVGTISILTGSTSPSPVIETFSYVIDWGDGSADSTGAATIDTAGVNIGDPVAGSFDGNHTYADNGVFTVTVTVTGSGGGSDTETFDVTVANVAPTLVISGSGNVNEGSSYTLNLSSFDPGDDTITQWTIDWGDGGIPEVVSGIATSALHVYADGDDNVTISATSTDEDGTFAAGNTVTVAVANVAPTLTISGDPSVNEGATYTLNLSETDPGADSITSWTITWGDGNVETVPGNPSNVTHTYADGPNNYTISATATDEDGTFSSNSISVTVANVAPTLTISGNPSVNEGATYTLNLSETDPGTDSIISWTINWGDGIENVTGNPGSVTHTYADGTVNYTISATATDEDGTFAAGNTVALTVNNVAPTANAGGPYLTFDDMPITLSGSGSDPANALDPLTFEWDLDNNGIFETIGANPVFNPVALGYTGTQTRTVQLRVSDGDGGQTIASTTVDLLGQGTIQIGGVLHVVGSNTANDMAFISKVNGSIRVNATFNATNPMLFAESGITEIQVRTRGGHDIAATSFSVNKPMTIDTGDGNDLITGGGARNLILSGAGNDFIFGGGADDVILAGAGNDDLFGGGGNDVLVGGDGNDMLDGGAGRDLIIGSQDEDYLAGGNDEDILIGGYTAHDSNIAALDAIMAVWGSAASFSSRVATLTGSGGLLQAGVTVFDDDDNDVIVGGAGRDLIFGDTNPLDGAVDLIALQPLLDVLVAVN